MSFLRVPCAALLLLSGLTSSVMAQTAPSGASAEQSTSRDIRVQVVAESSAVIGAPMSGLLEKFPLRDGDHFAKGDMLAEFMCNEQESALKHARAVLAGRRAVLVSSQKLKQLGSGSAVDFEVATASTAEAQADEEMAQARIKPCTVTAPFGGHVAGVAVHNHQFMQLGSPMLDIVGDATLEVQMNLPSAWLAFIKIGTEFDIDVDEVRHRHHAKISRISGRVDAVSQSIKVYAQITDDTQELRAGMSGRALIIPPADAK